MPHQGSFYEDMIPFLRASPSSPTHFPKALIANAVALGVRLSTGTRRTQQTLNPYLLALRIFLLETALSGAAVGTHPREGLTALVS